MPLRLDIKKKLLTHSERVKCIDFHPVEPWILSALYSGHLIIHNYNEQTVVRMIEVASGIVIRSAKFIPSKQWIICGSDDMMLRVFNYNSTEKVKEIEQAHNDFIRNIAIHPTLPYVLSCSDDMVVKLWNFSKDWAKVTTFEGHLHYVMMATWNPRDHKVFATASLDRTIKIWSILTHNNSSSIPTTSKPNFSLTGHESGVNSVQYSKSDDKPYLISAGDDKTIRVWDYLTKQCISVLSGAADKGIICTNFHPLLPVIFGGGEDETLFIWHSITFRLETQIQYKCGRIWSIGSDGGNLIGLGTDEGTIVLHMGNNRVLASFKGNKAVFAAGHNIYTVNTGGPPALEPDGSVVAGPIFLPLKDMGPSEIFAQSISHSPNGRLIAVCGDGEFVIYTSQALRNQAYGKAMEFVWASSDGRFATRIDTGDVLIHQNLKEVGRLVTPFPVDEIFGGPLVGVKSCDFICFYDWNTLQLVRRINSNPRFIFWNDSGTKLCIATNDNNYFLLAYSSDVITMEHPEEEEGFTNAFTVLHEYSNQLESGIWATDDCFVCNTSHCRVYFHIGNITESIGFSKPNMWLIGYRPDVNCLYFAEFNNKIHQHPLDFNMIEYLTAISRNQYDTSHFEKVPKYLHNRIAKCLEGQGHREMALAITTDVDFKFDLARLLGKTEICTEILRNDPRTTKRKRQWTQLGDLALDRGDLSLAIASYKNSAEYNSLLLIYSSTGDYQGLLSLANECRGSAPNVAFMCYVLTNQPSQCISVLLDSDRVPEAALFANTYQPNDTQTIVDLWNSRLANSQFSTIMSALAGPRKSPEHFPSYEKFLKEEKADDHAKDDHAMDDHAMDDHAKDDHAKDDHAKDDQAKADHAKADHAKAVDDHAKAVDDHAKAVDQATQDDDKRPLTSNESDAAASEDAAAKVSEDAEAMLDAEDLSSQVDDEEDFVLLDGDDDE